MSLKQVASQFVKLVVVFYTRYIGKIWFFATNVGAAPEIVTFEQKRFLHNVVELGGGEGGGEAASALSRIMTMRELNTQRSQQHR